MKALSIRNPWPWLILRPDLRPEERERLRADGLLKDVENRSWRTTFHGPVLIHAGKTMTRDDYEAAQLFLNTFCEIVLPPREQLLFGGIVGQATISGCVDHWDSDWFTGEYGLVLRDQKPRPFMPYKGALGFFDVPEITV